MIPALAANLPALGTEARFPLLHVAFSTMSVFESGWNHEGGLDGYIQHQREHVDEPMSPGPAFNFFKRLLEFNVHSPDPQQSPLVHVHVVSRQDPMGAGVLRFTNSLNHYGMMEFADAGLRHCTYLKGRSPVPTLLDLGVRLFLSTDRDEVRRALKRGVAAAHVAPAVGVPGLQEAAKLTIAFDGKAVIFDEEAERVFERGGLSAVVANEQAKARTPLGPGPFHGFLLMLHAIRALFPRDPVLSPLNLVFATSQGFSSQARVIRTLQSWDVTLDRADFFGGGDKGPMLKAMGVTIFFDGSASQVASARRHGVPAGHVPSFHCEP